MDQYIDQERELEIKKQQTAAAAYFFKKTDQYIAFEAGKHRNSQKANSTKLFFNFHKVISLSAPNLPPCLQKYIATNVIENKSRKDSDKIQVIVQLLSCPETSSCLSIDTQNNCISLTNPTPSRKFTASNAPKLFPVDSIINEDCPLMEICSNSLGAVIRSVANGEDACVISFGNVPTNELNSIIGSDKSVSSMGVMPCAILWLFNYIRAIRKQEYARFSVRISAAEISGKQEICRDLLSSISNTSNDNQILNSSSSLFNSLVELRAVNVEKAAYYLDYALTERSKSEENGLSHMFLTLHLYQYHLQNDSGISGGRSRLHIIDLGCGRMSEDIESTALSIQGISKVIYALWSNQRYIPNPDSILAQTLKRIIVNSYGMMQTSMLIKVSGKETQYNEALQVVQLASKLYRQKIRSMKLSSSICSDDNSSSSDSFSIRRMTKLRYQLAHNSKRNDRFNRSLSISSDIDATSSSEVSCDTVIYRGQPNSPPTNLRGNADGSSQGQIVIPHSEDEDKKPEQKLTLFQLKRRTGNKTNSNAWPKVAVKKAKEVMKSGQELWVDGPQAFCSKTTNQFNKPILGTASQPKETNEQEKIVPVLDKIHEKCETKDELVTNSGNVPVKIANKTGHVCETPVNRTDYITKTKHHLEKFNNENALKSMMVTDWLRNQPELHEAAEKQKTIYDHLNGKGNKVEIDKPNVVVPSIQRIKPPKLHTEVPSTEHRITATNFQRIEDWIRNVSIESPKRVTSPLDCGVVMTQSLYSPSCSPYHLSDARFNSFSKIPLSPPSAPINYTSNVCDQNTGSLRGCSVPPASVGSEIENECSRLWFYSPLINDNHLMPFLDIIDDTNNNRTTSFSGTPLPNLNQIESVRTTSFRNPPNLSNCQISLPHYEQNIIPSSNNFINYGISKYSTLPLDTHSPKHNNSKHCSKTRPSDANETNKSNEVFNFTQNTETPIKPNNDVKRAQKEPKRKENKKGFGFLNHLMRNKKLKKDLSLNRSGKEDTSTTEPVCQTTIKPHECHVSDSTDYVKKAGPPLLLSSPYHMVTQPKVNVVRADSSGHGSDCSSFKEVKPTQVSVNFHQENAGYRFSAYRRAGSSGYESVVRDSELSSHNDSASECSAPTNITLQSKNIHNPISNSITTTQNLSSSQNTTKCPVNTEKEKQTDNINYIKESQKVFELIKAEKMCMLELEQEEMKNELINVLKFFNDDVDNSRKYLESHLFDMENSEDNKSSEFLQTTNQTLRSVLNRYQSNLSMVTSFVGKPQAESFFD